MDSIANLFQQRAAAEKINAANIRSKRDEQIQRFHARGSIKLFDKKTKQLRLATKEELALILRKYKTDQLHPFYKECENARSFSKFFWWVVKGGKANSK